MPLPSKKQNIEISLPSQLGYERVAMASAESYAKMLGLTPERIEDLKTIVAEAAINAMQHGNKERPDARVTVSMTFKGEGFKGFLPDPDIERIVNEQDPPVGFGTFLIRQLADQVEIDKTADGANFVRMTIKL
jgi:anti-sigma regulatory factor (Ser/Thr protein kinase)